MKLVFVTVLSMLCWLSACADRVTQTSSSPGVSPSAAPTETNSAASSTPPVSDNTGSSPARDITPEIQKLIADQLGLKPEEVAANTPLSKLKKPADELDVIEIIMTVEERFGIEIKDDELGGSDVTTVTDITAMDLADIVVSRRKRK